MPFAYLRTDRWFADDTPSWDLNGQHNPVDAPYVKPGTLTPLTYTASDWFQQNDQPYAMREFTGGALLYNMAGRYVSTADGTTKFQGNGSSYDNTVWGSGALGGHGCPTDSGYVTVNIGFPSASTAGSTGLWFEFQQPAAGHIVAIRFIAEGGTWRAKDYYSDGGAPTFHDVGAVSSGWFAIWMSAGTTYFGTAAGSDGGFSSLSSRVIPWGTSGGGPISETNARTGGARVRPVQDNTETHTNVSTFTISDLNAALWSTTTAVTRPGIGGQWDLAQAYEVAPRYALARWNNARYDLIGEYAGSAARFSPVAR